MTFRLWIAKKREFLTAAFASLSAELFHFCPDVENSLQNPVDCRAQMVWDWLDVTGAEEMETRKHKPTEKFPSLT